MNNLQWRWSVVLGSGQQIEHLKASLQAGWPDAGKGQPGPFQRPPWAFQGKGPGPFEGLGFGPLQTLARL